MKVAIASPKSSSRNLLPPRWWETNHPVAVFPDDDFHVTAAASPLRKRRQPWGELGDVVAEDAVGPDEMWTADDDVDAIARDVAAHRRNSLAFVPAMPNFDECPPVVALSGQPAAQSPKARHAPRPRALSPRRGASLRLTAVGGSRFFHRRSDALSDVLGPDTDLSACSRCSSHPQPPRSGVKPLWQQTSPFIPITASKGKKYHRPNVPLGICATENCLRTTIHPEGCGSGGGAAATAPPSWREGVSDLSQRSWVSPSKSYHTALLPAAMQLLKTSLSHLRGAGLLPYVIDIKLGDAHATLTVDPNMLHPLMRGLPCTLVRIFPVLARNGSRPGSQTGCRSGETTVVQFPACEGAPSERDLVICFAVDPRAADGPYGRRGTTDACGWEPSFVEQACRFRAHCGTGCSFTAVGMSTEEAASHRAALDNNDLLGFMTMVRQSATMPILPPGQPTDGPVDRQVAAAIAAPSDRFSGWSSDEEWRPDASCAAAANPGPSAGCRSFSPRRFYRSPQRRDIDMAAAATRPMRVVQNARDAPLEAAAVVDALPRGLTPYGARELVASQLDEAVDPVTWHGFAATFRAGLIIGVRRTWFIESIAGQRRKAAEAARRDSQRGGPGD